MSAVDFELVAELREDQGKGASRRLRHANKVPGIIYGAGKDPVAISVVHHDLWNHLQHEAFYSHVLTIKIGKKTEKGILKDLQRHPAKAQLLHFDILRVKAGEKLKTKVPLHFLNEETSPGVKAGGVVSHNVTELEIECLPKNLPEYIEVDAAELELGHAIHLSQLTLPEGVEMVLHGELDEAHDQPVVSINEPKKVVEEEPVEAADEAADDAAPEAADDDAEKGEDAGE